MPPLLMHQQFLGWSVELQGVFIKTVRVVYKAIYIVINNKMSHIEIVLFLHDLLTPCNQPIGHVAYPWGIKLQGLVPVSHQL